MLIFLDFDGVLIPVGAPRVGRYREADPMCVANLNFLTRVIDASIVVTSSWRILKSVEDLQRLLEKWGVMAPCIGKTGHLPMATRGIEVADWIRRQAYLGPFIVLDDGADMDPVMDHLVQTKYDVGLSTDDVTCAIAMAANGRLHQGG